MDLYTRFISVEDVQDEQHLKVENYVRRYSTHPSGWPSVFAVNITHTRDSPSDGRETKQSSVETCRSQNIYL